MNDEDEKVGALLSGTLGILFLVCVLYCIATGQCGSAGYIEPSYHEPMHTIDSNHEGVDLTPILPLPTGFKGPGPWGW